MASSATRDSMEVALVVADRKLKDARTARGNSVAEVPYDSHTDKLRVKQYVGLGGREYQLGVECSRSRSNASGPAAPKPRR